METTKEEMPFNVDTAEQFANQDRIAEWVQAYLSVEKWANPALAAGLRLRDWEWHGPMEIALEKLVRVMGPEDGMPIKANPLEWEERVMQLSRSIKDLRALPPLIVRGDGEVLTITDGNHRHEAMRRMGLRLCWVLVWQHS